MALDVREVYWGGSSRTYGEPLDSDARVIPVEGQREEKKIWSWTAAQFKWRFGQANGETSSQGRQEEESHILLK